MPPVHTLLSAAASREAPALLVLVVALLVIALAPIAAAVSRRGLSRLMMAAGPRFNVGHSSPVPPPGPGAPIDTTPRFGGPLPAQGSHHAAGGHAGYHGVHGYPPPPGWPNYPGATFQPADPPPADRRRRSSLPTD